MSAQASFPILNIVTPFVLYPLEPYVQNHHFASDRVGFTHIWGCDVMRSYKPDEIVRIQVFQGDVRDGDSFGARDLTDNSQIEVRLFGIDAPEGLQTHGNESGDELRSILFEGDSGPSDFNMRFMDWDVGSENEAVQRVVGLVYKEYPDESVNGQIVRSGWAYWFQRYDPLNSFGFRELEEEARGEEIGIWKGDRLEIKPWDYRRFHRRFTEDSDALIDTIERRVKGRRLKELDAIATR